MRLTSWYLALLALALPAHAPADDSGAPAGSRMLLAQERRPQPARPSAPAPVRAAPQPGTQVAPRATTPWVHPTAPAPPRTPGYYYGPGYYPYYSYYVSPWAYSVYLGAPWWWGWGWGYGWYPVYPAPPTPAPGEGPPPNRISTEIAIAGGPTQQQISSNPALSLGSGSSVGLTVRVEGRDLGIHASYDGFFTNGYSSGYSSFGSSSALDYYTAHVTWSFISGRSGRLRLEGGLAVLNWASLPPYGSASVASPDFGLSGQVALLGPLGVVGYARVAPWAHSTADFQLAAALRLGPVALSGGWRDLRAYGGSTAPDLRFAGPQFGLALLF